MQNFIFSSTAAVYGVPATVPVAEDAPLNPMSPYGASKAMTERMLADAAAAYGLRSAVLRYFNVAGADPQGRAGQSTRGATHLLKVAIEAATGQRDHVAVFGTDYDTPDGTGIRDYIHVSDLVARAFGARSTICAPAARTCMLNCGYGRGYSVLELLDAVQRVSGRTLDIRARARRAGDIPVMVAAADAHPPRARLAAALRRHRRHRRARARLGRAARAPHRGLARRILHVPRNGRIAGASSICGLPKPSCTTQ